MVKCFHASIFILLTCCGFIACSTSNEGSSAREVDHFKSFQLSINSESKKLAHLINQAEFIQLEETDESLLSTVNRVLTYQGEYLVLSKQGQEIVFFNSKGDYIRSFNKAGEGPEEYDVIHDFWIKDDTLKIYSRSSSEINEYTLRGEWLSTRKLPFRAGHINQVNDSYMAEMNFYPIDDSLFYKFVVFNNDDEPVVTFLRNGELPNNTVWSNLNSVMPYKDGLLGLRMYSDTVYYYHENEIEPLVHIDFGESWYWKDRRIFRSEDYERIPESNQVWEMAVDVGSMFIYNRSIVAYSHWQHYLVDRNSGSSIRIDLTKGGEGEYQLTNLGWRNNQLLFSMPAEDALELMNELGTNSEQDLAGSENPMLVKIRFKKAEDW